MIKKISLIFLSALVLSACGSKTTAKITPTPTPKLVEMAIADRPKISLLPREDGHMLFLKMEKVSSNISTIEYELIYNAGEDGVVMEKGLADTIKVVTPNISRDLLLGTESCTNGCKYKFDNGVNGGTLSITFATKNGQVSTFNTPFALNSTADIKKTGEIKLSTENFSVKPKNKLTGNDYFVLIKNYQGGFSVFSNSTNSLVGDYPSN